MEKAEKVFIIGNGRIPRAEILSAIKSKPLIELKCKRCGSTKDVMNNGYCYDCEEELSKPKFH